MPSSGSTTSRMASSTSAKAAVVTAAPAEAPTGATPGAAPATSVASACCKLPSSIAFFPSYELRTAPIQGAGGQGLDGGVLERHPGQEGALHAGRVLGHAGEGYPVLQYRLVRYDLTTTAHHLGEGIHSGHRFRHGLVDHQLVP